MWEAYFAFHIFRTEAKEFAGFLIHLLFDMRKNLALLAALSVIIFMIEQLKKIGIRTEYLEHIEFLPFEKF